jgi:hypothetical protein
MEEALDAHTPVFCLLFLLLVLVLVLVLLVLLVLVLLLLQPLAALVVSGLFTA